MQRPGAPGSLWASADVRLLDLNAPLPNRAPEVPIRHGQPEGTQAASGDTGGRRGHGRPAGTRAARGDAGGQRGHRRPAGTRAAGGDMGSRRGHGRPAVHQGARSWHLLHLRPLPARGPQFPQPPSATPGCYCPQTAMAPVPRPGWSPPQDASISRALCSHHSSSTDGNDSPSPPPPGNSRVYSGCLVTPHQKATHSCPATGGLSPCPDPGLAHVCPIPPTINLASPASLVQRAYPGQALPWQPEPGKRPGWCRSRWGAARGSC